MQNSPQQSPPNREITLNLTPEQLAEWKQYETTREVFRWIREWRADLLEQMGRGCFLNLGSAEATALQAAVLSGEVQGYDRLLEIKAEEPEPEPEKE